MAIVILILFFIVILFSLREKTSIDTLHSFSRPPWSFPALLLLLLFLSLIAAFKDNSMPDYDNYERIFRYADFEFDRYEIGNIVLVKAIRSVTNSLLLFFWFYAIISVGLKFFVIYRSSPSIFLSVAVLMSSVFILHDMIQIRCAVASSFFLFALYFRSRNDYLKCFFFSLLSFAFHYSAIVSFLLFITHPQKRIWLYALLIPISYTLALTGHSFGYLAEYVPGGFEALWKMYEGQDDPVNIFNINQLTRCAFFYLILAYYKRISQNYPLVILLLKYYALGICSLVLFVDVRVISFRLNSFFIIVEILLIPSVLYIKQKNLWFGRLLVLYYCIIGFIISIIVNKFI